MTQIAGDGGGGCQVLCVIMTQCVRKLICDSPLIKGKKILIGKNHFFLSKSNTFALNF